ncbi:MAG TPA: GerW family sporulation protein [Symbiobacteriaceae bacterium]|nr:GerW family sporulation protein [Symbiobacteriaceae bacterium]
MAEHPIQGLMKTAMESLKGMIDVNTVVGDPVETQGGDVIIPISRVAFGFATGGGEYATHDGNPETAEFPFAGGSGAGVSVQPVGFLVVGQTGVRMLPVEGGQPIDRLIEMAPQLIEKLRGRGGKPNRNENVPGATDMNVPRTSMQ